MLYIQALICFYWPPQASDPAPLESIAEEEMFTIEDSDEEELVGGLHWAVLGLW